MVLIDSKTLIARNWPNADSTRPQLPLPLLPFPLLSLWYQRASGLLQGTEAPVITSSSINSSFSGYKMVTHRAVSGCYRGSCHDV